MFEVVSVTDLSDHARTMDNVLSRNATLSRRGGFVHGTKIATTRGWKPVERVAAGDLVRTLDHGFKEVRRIATDRVSIATGEMRAEYLPVYLPSRAAYNGRPVWLMPEQGVALDISRIEPGTEGVSVIPARMLSGMCRMTSQAPSTTFDVSTLFFDCDEVVFLEGGLQAFCPASRFGSRGSSDQSSYQIAEAQDADHLVDLIAYKGELSALANPLGALPAPIPQEPIFPVRPQLGVRRPGRPGRPNVPALFLRPEWQT